MVRLKNGAILNVAREVASRLEGFSSDKIGVYVDFCNCQDTTYDDIRLEFTVNAKDGTPFVHLSEEEKLDVPHIIMERLLGYGCSNVRFIIRRLDLTDGFSQGSVNCTLLDCTEERENAEGAGEGQ